MRLYESHCGYERAFDVVLTQGVENVMSDIKTRGDMEYRIGSRWDMHSKLRIYEDREGNVAIDFNPNLDPSERKGRAQREAVKAGKTLRDAVRDYLSSG